MAISNAIPAKMPPEAASFHKTSLLGTTRYKSVNAMAVQKMEISEDDTEFKNGKLATSPCAARTRWDVR